MAFDVEQAFGELRSRVHGAPSVRAFSAICRLAQSVEEAAPGVFAERMYGYANDQLATWPTRCVTLSVHYEDGDAFSRLVWSPLARGVVVTRESWHDYTHADYVRCVRAVAGREHVAVDRFRVGGGELVGFVEGGLLDGFRSVELRGIDLTGSLGALCEVLASRDGTHGLEELRLVGCRWGEADLSALSASRLASRLRVLGLSQTTWPRGYWFETLGRFTRLERLELMELGLTETEAIALAQAPAPETLRHVNLGGTRWSRRRSGRGWTQGEWGGGSTTTARSRWTRRGSGSTRSRWGRASIRVSSTTSRCGGADRRRGTGARRRGSRRGRRCGAVRRRSRA